jgi:hypothetical protein
VRNSAAEKFSVAVSLARRNMSIPLLSVVKNPRQCLCGCHSKIDRLLQNRNTVRSMNSESLRRAKRATRSQGKLLLVTLGEAKQFLKPKMVTGAIVASARSTRMGLQKGSLATAPGVHIRVSSTRNLAVMCVYKLIAIPWVRPHITYTHNAGG